jgi:hypothetical protein
LARGCEEKRVKQCLIVEFAVAFFHVVKSEHGEKTLERKIKENMVQHLFGYDQATEKAENAYPLYPRGHQAELYSGLRCLVYK